ncbi:YeiH family protein [Marinilactibacillus kalidii]|uniref:YeiH family protein n=1 Tax=Marinilactibacillus kalidii TaxID=2820274 RepID=UPI001ABECD07|nr:YeiH family protein [Marinilactibacillus kalidii]
MKKVLPGFALAIAIAIVATWLESILPIHVIGSSVLAMFIGMLMRPYTVEIESVQPGIAFTGKKILKFAIVLLGASLNLTIVLEVGGQTIVILIFTLLTAFLGGALLGKWMGINSKLTIMIAAGTGICGGSAIAALSPVIDAEDKDISYAISATILFDMVMIILYPIMGRALALSDKVFGYWSGTSVNDTSSVVATSFAFSEAAGEIATMVKLTRTLAIIPTVLIFSYIYFKKNRKNKQVREKVQLNTLFPWFIIFFIGMAALNSFGLITASQADILKGISRFLMVAALAAIGLKTDIRAIRKTGIKPFIFANVLSLLVVVVSIAVILLQESL